MRCDTSSTLTFTYHRDGRFTPEEVEIVSEFPLKLMVNEREIATLVGSRHDLPFLVAGFLRLQGFVESVDDFDLFSVCDDFGVANIRIRRPLPEKLTPVLTSGCGTGITFTLPGGESSPPSRDRTRVTPETIFSLLKELSELSPRYSRHGGIHSAAIARDGHIILRAEDLGRHNTIDRLAGEALFRKIPLEGTILLASGRVSSEMAAKGSLLGVSTIISRTSPTDLAIRLCSERGITLIGYARGGSFITYTHPWRVDADCSPERIAGFSAVILAGGRSTRMGREKSMIEVDGVPMIQRVYQTLSPLFPEVIIVTNDPDRYDSIPCRKVPDIYPGAGSIAGVHAGLANASFDRIFAVACDMPFLSPPLIREICRLSEGFDAAIPFSDTGFEPLHGVYARSGLPLFEDALSRGELRIYDLYPRMNHRIIPWDDISSIDGARDSFRNINTPNDLPVKTS